LAIGTPIDAPWPGQKFTVLDRFDRARVVRDMEPVDPVREDRAPAVLVSVREGEQSNELWLQKYRPRSFTSGQTAYELSFGDKEIPLEFGVRLDRFEIGTYPGERRPRSFTSQITIIDPMSGGTESKVVSMNNPAAHGGYSFYQSSYRVGKARTASFLSVGRDPGLPIVFLGYIATMAGMVITLVTRSIIYRRMGKKSKPDETGVKSSARLRELQESSTPVAAAATAE
jgi:cytochrome c biogenesis protein ResB